MSASFSWTYPHTPWKWTPKPALLAVLIDNKFLQEFLLGLFFCLVLMTIKTKSWTFIVNIFQCFSPAATSLYWLTRKGKRRRLNEIRRLLVSAQPVTGSMWGLWLLTWQTYSIFMTSSGHIMDLCKQNKSPNPPLPHFPTPWWLSFRKLRTSPSKNQSKRTELLITVVKLCAWQHGLRYRAQQLFSVDVFSV